MNEICCLTKIYKCSNNYACGSVGALNRKSSYRCSYERVEYEFESSGSWTKPELI